MGNLFSRLPKFPVNEISETIDWSQDERIAKRSRAMQQRHYKKETVIPKSAIRKIQGVQVLILNNNPGLNDKDGLPLEKSKKKGRMMSLGRLVRLELRGCAFSAVPQGLPPMLQHLDLSKNRLFYGSLEALGGYFHLQHLNLSGNQLESLPSHLEDLTQLKELILSENLFTTIPDCVHTLKTLEKLELVGNKIAELDMKIGHLVSLTHLDLTGNRLKFLPIHHGQEPLGFSRLLKLSHLNLSNNCMEKLPDSLGNLVELQHVNLSKNVNLIQIPDAWHTLDKLVFFDISSTMIQVLPPVFAHWKSLQELKMSNIPQMETLPSHLGYMTNLIRLDMSGCSLASIPQELDLLENLQVLDLRKNMLHEIPMIKGGKLVKVLLGNNHLVQVPGFLLQPLGVLELDLSHNLLRQVPGEMFSNLVLLERLYLSGNQLEHLPPTIKHLNRLKVLECRNNQLSGIPNEVGGCSALQKLDVVTNMILQLPDTFRLLDQLKIFEAMDNPWLDPPQEVIHAGLIEIMAHIKARKNK